MADRDRIPILLVDDRPENLTALEALLEDMELDIFKATSGNEALRLSLKHDFSIVLMDVRMPDMDGFETAELMRANPKTNRLPIIFVTAAMKDTEHQFKGYEAGAFDYLLKPVEPTILRSKMRVFCDLYRQRRMIEMHEQQLETLVGERTAELNKTLESLRESERRFRDLLESVTSYMYTVSLDHGRVVSTTHGAGCLAVTGFSAQEFAADPDLWYRMVHAEDRPAVLAAARQVLLSKAAHTFEHRIQHKSGSTRWVQTTLVPRLGPEGLLLSYDGVITDITERKRDEELIRNILESVDEGFIIIDRDFRILSANRAYANMTAMPPEEVIGRLCYEVSHRASAPCFKAGYECAVERVFQTGRAFSSIHHHMDSKGGGAYIETKAYPLSRDRSGGVMTAIETLVDITEKQKLEDQLRQSQKMESIGTLAGGVAHDFNNILTAIIGYGNIALMRMAKDDPHRSIIEHMLDASERAAQLTKDLLLFSRKQPLDRQSIDLNESIRKLGKFLTRVIGEDITFKILLSGGAIPVLADDHQIGQVLMNLATNSRDAMPNGGTFTISTEKVHLDEEFTSKHLLRKPGAYALISVSDTGTGMDEETRPRIFEPFYTTKEVGKGTGLGLSVVYGIIKQHDGHITVYSEPGQGTIFRIYLPVIPTVAAVPKTSAVEERPVGGNETILLAEDDENVRNLTVSILEEFGYAVITAADGEEAVSQYRKQGDKIQLLYVDLIMPKKNGKEVYDEIRQMRPDIKVIFASGYAPDFVRDKAYLGDRATIVSKPISPMDLLKKVRSVLDQGRG